MPREQINIVPNGDRSVPIINYADLLAFQIGLLMNERYRKYHPGKFSLDIEPHKIEYDSHRTLKPLTNEARENLESIIERWRKF